MKHPPCIFCHNESGSPEHLWPDWMHNLVKFAPIDMQCRQVFLAAKPISDPSHRAYVSDLGDWSWTALSLCATDVPRGADHLN